MSAGRAYLVIGLMLASVLAWRQGELFTGGLDYVVVAKAVLGVSAFILAVWGPTGSGRRPRAHVGLTVALLACYLAITLAGALYAEHFLASAVLAVRVTLIAATVLALAMRVPGPKLLSTFSWTCTVIAVFSATTGGLIEGFDRRLDGGIPAIAANELALLAALGILYTMWRASTGSLPFVAWTAIPVLISILLMTQSRTALLMLGIALALMFVQLRVLSPWAVIANSVLVPVALYAVLMTDLLRVYFDRGGAGSVATLNSRTIAWESALTAAPTVWAQWFGQGLAVKSVDVNARFWTTQLLDSTWFSALVQAGWLGTAVLALLTAVVLLRVVAMPAPARVPLLSMLGFLLGRSLLESGLFDASPALILFLIVAFTSSRQGDLYATSSRADNPSVAHGVAPCPPPDRDEHAPTRLQGSRAR